MLGGRRLGMESLWGGAAHCYRGLPTPMNMYKLSRKYCAILFTKGKYPIVQKTDPDANLFWFRPWTPSPTICMACKNIHDRPSYQCDKGRTSIPKIKEMYLLQISQYRQCTTPFNLLRVEPFYNVIAHDYTPNIRGRSRYVYGEGPFFHVWPLVTRGP